MKFGYLFLALFILFLSLGCVHSQENITEDLSANITVLDHDFSDIQSAIDNAAENDTIILNGTYCGLGKQINITKTVTLEAIPDATLNAKNGSRILNVTADNVVLKNLTFINGKADNGGAIYASGNLTLISCVFKDNYAINKVPATFGDGDISGYVNDAHGGAIFAEARLECINTTFTGNYTKDPNVRYEDLSFENRGSGGAIYSGTFMTVSDEDGSWMVECPAGELTLTNCLFSRNYDALRCNANVNVTDSIFKENTGFMTFYCGSNSIFKNTTFSRNRCLELDSWEHSRDLQLLYTSDNASFIDCAFTDNFQGNIGTVNAAANTTVINCLFENNTAAEGGAIHMGGGKIVNSTFTANRVMKLSQYEDEFGYAGAVEYWGNLEIINSTFQNNRASLGAALSSMEWFNRPLNLTITDSIFENNLHSAVAAQGSVKITSSSTTRTLKGKAIVLNDSLEEISPVNVDYIASFKTLYLSGDKYPVKMTFSTTGEPVNGYVVEIRVYKNGKKVKYLYKRSDENGLSIFTYLSCLDAGRYTLKITSFDYGLFSYSADLTVKKASATAKAPKIRAEYRKSAYFKVNLKHKTTRKPLKNIALKVKVYTGKKCKTYTIKTRGNGIAKLNTRRLSRGSHRVVVSSASGNVKTHAKSKIIIR